MADEVRSLDLIAPTAPALSTTSDMPKANDPKTEKPNGAVSDAEIKAGETKEVKPDDKKVDEKVIDTKADDKLDDKTGDKKDEPKVDDTPPHVKREITKARNRQREAEARASTLEERLDKALTALEKAATRTDTKVETTQAEPRPERPQRVKFDTPDEYDVAMAKYDEQLVSWSAKTAAKVTQAEIEKQTKEREASESKQKTEREQQEQWETIVSAWHKSRTAGIEKYPDYEEVAEATAVPINVAIRNAILDENLESGKGFELTYYLGQHLEEAAKIAALPTQNAVERAIGRLAERLAAVKPVPVSKVPEPPKPVGSKASAAKKSAEDESMEEYATRRNASLRPQRATPH